MNDAHAVPLNDDGQSDVSAPALQNWATNALPYHAKVDQEGRITFLGQFASEHEATQEFVSRQLTGRHVSLILEPGQVPQIGDRVEVDEHWDARIIPARTYTLEPFASRFDTGELRALPASHRRTIIHRDARLPIAADVHAVGDAGWYALSYGACKLTFPCGREVMFTSTELKP